MELKEFLVWFTTAGAAIAAFYLVEKIARLAELPAEPKRIAAFALAGGLAVAAWLAQVGLAYIPAPVGWVAWVEQVFAVATAAFGLSQLIHGRAVLSKF